MILTQHKIEIEKAVNAAKLNKHGFIKQDEEMTFKLVPKGSNFFFQFVLVKADTFHVYTCDFKTFAPNAQITTKKVEYNIHDLIKTYFEPWLKNHAAAYFEGVNLKDPWIDVDYHDNDTLFDDRENEKFTPEEINRIESSLDKIPVLVKGTLEIEQPKIDFLIKEVGDLKKELTSLTRRKWLRNFKGFVYQELWEVIKNPEKRQIVITFIKDFIETIKNNIPLLN